MNNKGMTLIELLAVIAIIALITIMIAPNVIGVRNRTLRSTLDSKILRIENAAIAYGNDNLVNVPSNFTDSSLRYVVDDAAHASDAIGKQCLDHNLFDPKSPTRKCENENYWCHHRSECKPYCLIVYVGKLIEQGYLSGDNASEKDSEGNYKGSSDKNAKKILTNPIDGTSLNEQMVCIRYDTDVVGKSEAGSGNISYKGSKQSEVPRKLVAYVINWRDLYDKLEE